MQGQVQSAFGEIDLELVEFILCMREREDSKPQGLRIFILRRRRLHGDNLAPLRIDYLSRQVGSNLVGSAYAKIDAVRQPCDQAPAFRKKLNVESLGRGLSRSLFPVL